MARLKDRIIRTGMEALYFSGASSLLRPLLGGRGVIFMLHHVRPARAGAFQPNRHLEISPEFLETVLAYLQAHNIALVTLDEMMAHLQSKDTRRLACFTFDDGYRDNRDHALAVMRRFGAPMTVYVTTEFADGAGRLWWVALERVIAASSEVTFDDQDGAMRIACATPEDKDAAFRRIHDRLRALPGDAALHAAMANLCAANGIDYRAISRELCMDWDELCAFADDPLVTIGAHTLSHCHLAKADENEALREMAESRQRIEFELQRPVRHLAYPYGDPAAAGAREFALAARAGFASAVTTRPGVVFAGNAAKPLALPRISLNGNYQNGRMLSVLTSGAATAMWNGFRRVDAA